MEINKKELLMIYIAFNEAFKVIRERKNTPSREAIDLMDKIGTELSKEPNNETR